MRNLNPSLTPIPNATSFGAPKTLFATLVHSGVEQFSCLATDCAQSAPSTGASTWTCDALSCSCIHGTTFCGGSTLLSIENIINALNGTLTVACDAPASNGAAHCSFQQSSLTSLFGPQGLGLDGCTFGECVRQNVIDTAANTTSTGVAQSGGSDLGTGVIAGLAVVGALLGLLLALLAWGCIGQRKARRGGGKAGLEGRPVAVGVEWLDLEYSVAAAGGTSLFSKRKHSGQKQILDHVSGRVQPGSIMAILGPSGLFLLASCSGHRLIAITRCREDDTDRDPRAKGQGWAALWLGYLPLVRAEPNAPDHRLRPAS
jgi:hypothetical protein